MTTSPILNPTANNGHNVEEKKPTVLESHGYTLGKTLGAGGYGTVRLAHSDRHAGIVAVKIMSKFTAPLEYLKKFLPRQIEVVDGLKHPNIIRFLQAIETTHRVYLVMEYAGNGSLLEVIRRDLFVDENRARTWLRQLVDAVGYCHNKGVVHRDIKCENMLMDWGNNIKLCDFDFAKANIRNERGEIPFSETYCGSYAYASPEILKGIPYQPFSTDVWSIGVVLYAMVYGVLPFDDTNFAALVKQVGEPIMFPSDPEVSSECRELVTKILAPVDVRCGISDIKADGWFNRSPSEYESCFDTTIMYLQPAVSTSIDFEVIDPNKKVEILFDHVSALSVGAESSKTVSGWDSAGRLISGSKSIGSQAESLISHSRKQLSIPTKRKSTLSQTVDEFRKQITQ